jgi:MoaA/NifB/PqqE/SkfB family radical SAM enzyme
MGRIARSVAEEFWRHWMENKVLKVEWLLTRKCDLHCSYCKIRDPKSLIGEELSFSQVTDGVSAIDRMFPRVPIVFFGGEPAVLDWLPDLVAHCESIELKYAIISNGMRALGDPDFFERLIEAGISNWSVSIDSLKGLSRGDAGIKSRAGFSSLLKFRSRGVRDLVACITVTKDNIEEVPSIIEELSRNGIWGIVTPLQVGDDTFEYSGHVPALQETRPEVVDRIAGVLYDMAKSGEFLMHNAPEYFLHWKLYFIQQDWKCSRKSCITVDADGSLKRCVDRKLELEKFSILTLEDNWEAYCEALKEPPACKGCFWDPAFETSMRASTWETSSAVDSFRHELTDAQFNRLKPETQKWWLEGVEDD